MHRDVVPPYIYKKIKKKLVFIVKFRVNHYEQRELLNYKTTFFKVYNFGRGYK